MCTDTPAPAGSGSFSTPSRQLSIGRPNHSLPAPTPSHPYSRRETRGHLRSSATSRKGLAKWVVRLIAPRDPGTDHGHVAVPAGGERLGASPAVGAPTAVRSSPQEAPHRAPRSSAPRPSRVSSPSAPDGRRLRDTPPSPSIWAGALGVQFLVLVGFGLLEFTRHSLTYDFAAYAQAWWLIGHGSLDPWSSVIGIRFVANNAELFVWLLALAAPVARTTFALIVLQDLALVATDAVAFVWILDLTGCPTTRLRATSRGSACEPRPGLAWTGLAVLVLDPWTVLVAAHPVHLEAFGGLFVTLVARALWRRRRRAIPLWAVGLLLTGFIGGLALCGVAVGELLDRRRNLRWGAALLAGGLGWSVTCMELGLAGAAGAFPSEKLGYLAPHGPASTGPAAILLALATHPGRAVAAVGAQAGFVLLLLLPLGVLGIATARGGAVAATIFGPALLLGPHVFARGATAYQFWPALPVVLVGTVSWLAGRRLSAPGLARVVRRIQTAWVAAAAVVLAVGSSILLPQWVSITPTEARVLGTVLRHTPPRAEVISTYAFSGSFAARAEIIPIMRPSEWLPIRDPEVVFVLAPSVGVGQVAAALTAHFARVVQGLPGARPVVDRNGITAYLWAPPGGTAAIEFPSGRPR